MCFQNDQESKIFCRFVSVLSVFMRHCCSRDVDFILVPCKQKIFEMIFIDALQTRRMIIQLNFIISEITSYGFINNFIWVKTNAGDQNMCETSKNCIKLFTK